ncbi:CGNR zinc finger domain-containing protein [Chryseobacterium echinoideorum]|uniref:CGNR zinc finger domain-containing protein n=1 Tax=Chryseobacterium echinoideorum TaxID=1549648 RepID=UPI001185536E|nr:CGNR zinc finger domain-containing protein [Chryseobacterium echinoideorum]
MGKFRSIGTLVIDSNILCCNFVNTVSSWKTEENYDYFATYLDFVDWCSKLKISNPHLLQTLRELAERQPEEALAALNRIKEIRRILQGLISAVAEKDDDKKQIFLPATNLLIVDAFSRQRLQFAEDKFFLDHIEASGDLIFPVWKVLHSLVNLLTQHSLERVKQCPKCGWVFLDETRNGSRKWCNPKYCGTSDKMKRYNKKKSGKSSENKDGSKE